MHPPRAHRQGEPTPPVSPKTIPNAPVSATTEIVNPTTAPTASPNTHSTSTSTSTSAMQHLTASKTYQHLEHYPLLTDATASLTSLTAHTLDLPGGPALKRLLARASDQASRLASLSPAPVSRVVSHMDTLGDRVLDRVDAYVPGLQQPTGQLVAPARDVANTVGGVYHAQVQKLAQGLRARAFPTTPTPATAYNKASRTMTGETVQAGGAVGEARDARAHQLRETRTVLLNAADRAGGYVVGSAIDAGAKTKRRGQEAMGWAAAATVEVVASVWNAVSTRVEEEMRATEPVDALERVDERDGGGGRRPGVVVWSKAAGGALAEWGRRKGRLAVEGTIDRALGIVDTVCAVGGKVWYRVRRQ